MTCHHPRNPPPEWETVLLLHWYDAAPDQLPLCETGFYAKNVGFAWHNPVHNTDGLEPMAWAPLPLLPSEPPR